MANECVDKDRTSIFAVTDFVPAVPWWNARENVLPGLSVMEMEYDIETNGVTFMALVVDLPRMDRVFCYAELFGSIVVKSFARYSHVCDVTFHFACDDLGAPKLILLVRTLNISKALEAARCVFYRRAFVPREFSRNRDVSINTLVAGISSDSLEWAARFARSQDGWQWITTDGEVCDAAIVFDATSIKNWYITAATFTNVILYQVARQQLKAYDASCSINEFGGLISIKSIDRQRVSECLKRLLNWNVELNGRLLSLRGDDGPIREIDTLSELARFRIAAYNSARAPAHPQDKFLLSLRRTLVHVTRGQIEKQIDAIGHCSAADMEKDMECLSIALKKVKVCVMGKRAKADF
ncbi:MAG: hypothetical protein LBL96_07515 [Clostridiales bacterium]|jgi:hypothetical protein|nr:hypothetical protein [Clostridiales bacterium]